MGTRLAAPNRGHLLTSLSSSTLPLPVNFTPITFVYSSTPVVRPKSLISLVHHHHPALLHHQALILDRLLTFLMAFSAIVLEPSFSQTLSLHSHLSFPGLISWNLTTRCLAVTGGGSIDECDRLSQPCRFLGALYIVIRTHLFT